MGDGQLLPDSARAPLPGARDLGPCPAEERLEVTMVLRARAPGGPVEAAALAARSGRPVDRDAFAEQYGAGPRDLQRVVRFAAAHDLAVVARSVPGRTVTLSGTAGAFGRAFGVELRRYRHPLGEHRGHAGAVRVPEELADVVVAVLGLDDRPQARPRFRRRDGPAQGPAAAGSFTPEQVAEAYGFPPATGAGRCIGLIELGGGFRPADLDGYFARLGVRPAPHVVTVSVDHTGNAPTGDPGGPDGEVELDIEVAGALAPGARIAVYFAPNTDRGFLDAVTAAVHDARERPDVLSISWGGPEASWSGQAMRALDQAIASAAALGIPVLCAAGDSGSSDGMNDGLPHVDFPASSPHATACGGTSLVASGGAIQDERVWNDGPGGGATGGGVSGFFGQPAWQAGAGVPARPGGGGGSGRGVPDVAGDADPRTGYRVLVDGVPSVIGGTSAVAPLWAALLVRIASARGSAGPIGFVNPALYGHPDALRDVTQGSNGAYAAGPGWDPCTGLGTPAGGRLADVL